MQIVIKLGTEGKSTSLDRKRTIFSKKGSSKSRKTGPPESLREKKAFFRVYLSNLALAFSSAIFVETKLNTSENGSTVFALCCLPRLFSRFFPLTLQIAKQREERSPARI